MQKGLIILAAQYNPAAQQLRPLKRPPRFSFALIDGELVVIRPPKRRHVRTLASCTARPKLGQKPRKFENHETKAPAILAQMQLQTLAIDYKCKSNGERF